MSAPTATVPTSFSFTTTFKLNASVAPVKRFVFTDTTNINTIITDGGYVYETFSIVSPGGTTIYNNLDNWGTPDINRATSAVNLIDIALPLNPDGSVVQGQYTITMHTKYNVVNGGSTVGYATTINTYNVCYTSPVVCINESVNCVSPLFTVTDITNYTVCDVIPTITRTLTAYPPQGSGGSTLVTSSAEIQTGTFYSGANQATVSTILSYTCADGLIIQDTVTGQKAIIVDCTWVCRISCCLRAFNTRMNTDKLTNQALYQQDTVTAGVVAFKLAAAFNLISCGKEADATAMLTEIQVLLNCTDDCNCGDTAPALVTGIGGGGSGAISIVDSCGSPITVTPVTVGDTTTYTICFDSALVTKINASYNSVVTAGSDNVTVTPTTVGSTTTYEVAVDIPKDYISFNLSLAFSGTNTVTPTISKVNIQGTTFQSPSYEAFFTGAAANPNLSRIYSFFAGTPNSNFKVVASPILNSVAGSTPPLTPASSTTDWANTTISGSMCLINLVGDSTTGEIRFRIEKLNRAVSGNPTRYADLCAPFGITLDINFLITA